MILCKVWKCLLVVFLLLDICLLYIMEIAHKNVQFSVCVGGIFCSSQSNGHPSKNYSFFLIYWLNAPSYKVLYNGGCNCVLYICAMILHHLNSNVPSFDQVLCNFFLHMFDCKAKYNSILSFTFIHMDKWITNISFPARVDHQPTSLWLDVTHYPTISFYCNRTSSKVDLPFSLKINHN